MPRYTVRITELHLGQDGPDRSGEIFSQLPDEHDPGPDPDRQRRAEGGQRQPPGLHRRGHGEQDADQGAEHRPDPHFGQRGLNLGPLAGDRVTAEANRSGTESPPDRPAGHDVPDRAGDGAHHLPRPGRASRSGFAAGTAFALRRKLTHQAGFAPWSGIAPGPGLGSPREFPTRSGFAPRCGFAVRAGCAARRPDRRGGQVFPYRAAIRHGSCLTCGFVVQDFCLLRRSEY
jgi:hypothetical protein